MNNPHRSAMRPGCQGVGRNRSANAGTLSSTMTSSAKVGHSTASGAASRATQRTWTMVVPPAYWSDTDR